MGGASAHEITGLLRAWGAGERGALEKLMPLVYKELHRVARTYLAGEPASHTLQTTALVNEVYLRLIDLQRINSQNRAQFLALCSQVMRHILTDFARSRRSQKRGGAAPPVSFDEAQFACERRSDLAALDDALKALEFVDARKGKVVELRFFGGLSVRETAEVLRISPETVQRDWKVAKVWLLRELSGRGRYGA